MTERLSDKQTDRKGEAEKEGDRKREMERQRDMYERENAGEQNEDRCVNFKFAGNGVLTQMLLN